jgi:hypothetical protein
MSTFSRIVRSGAIFRRPLSGETAAPAELDEAALREAWRFRGGFVDLKPGVAPEDDYQAFRATLLRGKLLWRMRDDAGGLRAMIMAIVEPGEHAGRPYVHLEFEYAFFDRAFRRSLASRLLFISTILRALAQARGRPVYLVAATYPAGALSLGEFFPLWMPGAEAGMSAWERGLRAAIGGACKGYDPETGLVTMRTLPRERRPPSRPAARASWDVYVRGCPRWSEGFTPLCLARVRLRGLVRSTLARVPGMLLRDLLPVSALSR